MSLHMLKPYPGTDVFVIDNYYDDNTVEVEVITKIINGSEGSNHNIDVQINYDAGHASSITAQGSVTATMSAPAWVISASVGGAAETDGLVLIIKQNVQIISQD